MTGTDYAQHFGCGVRALEAYEREGSPEQVDAAQKAFTYALRSVPADLPETERDRYRAAALGNLAGVWYARGARTGSVHAVHQAMRHLNEAFSLCDEESTTANLASIFRLWQRLLPKHDLGELTEALNLLRELKERGATRGGALNFDASVALLFTYEERLRRREHEGDRLALAESAEETARIAVEQDREDAASFLKTAAAHFLAVADHPGEGEGYARKALDLAAEALSRCEPGSDDHHLYSFDWALTALMCLSKNENLPDIQVERMLPLLHESVHHKVASDADSHFPELVTRSLVLWWEGSGRTDRRAARAALAHAEVALATLNEDSLRLVPALHTIGILLQHRYAEETGSLADLRQAAVCFQRITELSAQDSPDHRDAAAHLMVCRLASPGEGPVLDLVHPDDFDEPDPQADPTEVMATAQGLLDSARGIFEKELVARALTLLGRLGAGDGLNPVMAADHALVLASALLRELRHRPHSLALGRAMDVLERAAAAQPESGTRRALLLAKIADCWHARYASSGSPLDLEEAIELACGARDMLPRGGRHHRDSTRQLGRLLLIRDRRSTEGLRLFREWAAPDDPEGSAEAAADWSRSAAGMGAWEEASTAAQIALRRALTGLEDAGGSLEDRLARIHDAEVIAVQAALVAVHAGDLESALRSLESVGSARALGPGEGPDLGPPPEGCVVVHLCASGGTNVLALGMDASGRTEALWLPVSFEDVVSQAGLSGLIQGDTPDPAWYRQTVDVLAGWAGEHLVKPVLEKWPTSWLCVIPHGTRLGSLPLHAAWWPDPTLPEGRRHVLDAVLVTVASGARRPRAGEPHPDEPGSILAVADPEPMRKEPLPGARREAEGAVLHFARSTLLTGTDARRNAVLAALPGAGVVHLATHGHTDALRPLVSGLVLADDETLSMAELLEQPLSGTRLLVLSACSLGQGGVFFLGPRPTGSLVQALLRTGVGGVVSSMWRAPDESSSLLIDRFYQLWRSGSYPHPAEALRKAQLWLRDVTNGELGGTPPTSPAARRFWEITRPYQHPVHWAAFGYAGV
ncbi:CHAT domain-containing protein [Streptomyces sp. AcE210]|uniref:CHAT domain-containing protein n=1 Tax=Streptomyces sp. AcE210 TaxID=2292703 RepID=UPI000E3067F4|nr:CHAT domain-containing protein [Streptomyces sp. AcE210]RFC77346.1 CHAT domain-containing protein [Streptomyces sp. AcE210]